MIDNPIHVCCVFALPCMNSFIHSINNERGRERERKIQRDRESGTINSSDTQFFFFSRGSELFRYLTIFDSVCQTPYVIQHKYAF